MNAAAKIEQAGNVRIITFAGARIRDDLVGSILGALGDDHLLLDFTHVESISSMELAALITLHKRIKTAGGRLTLFNLHPDVFEVFSITRLEKLFSICREQAALAAP
ncbi:MAG: STAS domain-containing protein [Gemmataceae bacterium]|nr:STAS domain-containing protein [Gemmataceae bacterium]